MRAPTWATWGAATTAWAYRRAIELHTQALAIARDIGDRYNEACTLTYLGLDRLASGDPRQAVTLLEQAVAIADTTGDIEPAAEARFALAQAQLQLGDPAAALTTTAAAQDLPYPAKEPVTRLLQGLALLELDLPGEAAQAFTGALTAADALLALADTNVTALQARALALAGLAATTSDPASASEAAQALAHTQAITSAAGVTADTHRLLETIAAHDQSGALAGLSTAQDLLQGQSAAIVRARAHCRRATP